MSSFKKILSSVDGFLKNKNTKFKASKIGEGGNGSCYKLFGCDYVVIDSIAYCEIELRELIEKTNQCKEKGINIIPIKDYAFSRQQDIRKRYLILQDYCKGKHLYSNLCFMHMTENCNEKEKKELVKKAFLLHLNESKTLATLDVKTYKKFIKDYIELSKSGIQIDSWNTENFIINEQGINFIDLGIRRYGEKSEKTLTTEIIDILIGRDYEFDFNNAFDSESVKEFNQYKKTIINKVFYCLEELKLPHITKAEIPQNIYLLPKQNNKFVNE